MIVQNSGLFLGGSGLPFLAHPVSGLTSIALLIGAQSRGYTKARRNFWTLHNLYKKQVEVQVGKVQALLFFCEGQYPWSSLPLVGLSVFVFFIPSFRSVQLS